jgi:hypothetical protein
MITKSLRYIIFLIFLLALQFRVFACDTLCVVYNEYHRKYEIDTLKNFFYYKCNQKEIGIYSDYLNKIIIPPIIAYNNYAGHTYFDSRGTEIKIIRGICDEFNYKIINCYTNNHFCFDSVMVSLKIPCFTNGRINNSFMSYKDLIHDYGITETDKKMEVIVSDSSHFRNLYDFNKELNLIDLTKTKDSLFIRVNYWSYPENKIYEIRFNQLGWQARMISYQVTEFRSTLSFIFLNKCFVYCSKKKKNASWLYQCDIPPTDSAYKTICKDSLWNILLQLNMLYLKKTNANRYTM